jgi:phosphatidylglycerol:prolipoprotein diacylglycerol transferase
VLSTAFCIATDAAGVLPLARRASLTGLWKNDIGCAPPFMVPFIHIPDLHVGPLPIHPFGLLVVTGVVIATSITIRRGGKMGYDTGELNSFITWMLLCGFVISHVLDEIFYHWDEVVSHPLILAMPWRGLSSFGGFFGMVVGMLFWRNVLTLDGPRIDLLGMTLIRLPRFQWRSRPLPILPFADLILSVFPIGWMFGRAGCASVHDHPGRDASLHNLMAVAYPACFPCRVVNDRVAGLAAGESP